MQVAIARTRAGNFGGQHMAGRRQRSDSVQREVAAFQEGRKTVSWPTEAVMKLPLKTLAKRAEKIFAHIMSTRHHSDFRQTDVILAAQLANLVVDLDRVNEKIAKDGHLVVSKGRNGKAHMIRNPSLDAAVYLGQRQLALFRALGISGLPADKTTIANAANQAARARQIRADMQDTDPDGLLAH